MIKTVTLLTPSQDNQIWLDGFAVNKKVGKWLYKWCGWNKEPYPTDILFQEEVIEAPEMDWWPCNPLELYVLGKPLLMN